MSKEDEKNYVIEKDGIGQVVIAEEVVAKIAGMAALEVEGVKAMAGTSTIEDVIGMFAQTNQAKGVHVNISEGIVSVDLVLVLTYDCRIPKVAKQVQEKVTSAIETMTGLKVDEVNIKIASVN